MKPKVLEMAEKPDGSFVFTAIDEDNPEVLYAYDNVKLLAREGTDEIYIEHEFTASVPKTSTYTEEFLKVNGEKLLYKLWESIL